MHLLCSCRGAFYSRTARSSTPRRIKKNKFKLKEFIYKVRTDPIPMPKKSPIEGKPDWTLPTEAKVSVSRFLLNDSQRNLQLQDILSAIHVKHPSITNIQSPISLPVLNIPQSKYNDGALSSSCSPSHANDLMVNHTSPSIDSNAELSQDLSMTCPWIKKLKQIPKDLSVDPVSLINEMMERKDVLISYSHIQYAIVAAIRLKDPDSAITLYKKCEELQIQRTIGLYSLVLEAHIKASKLSDALQMYCYLRVNAMIPSPAILNSLLSALIKKDAIKTAWKIFYEAKSNFTLPVYIYSLMIDLCAKRFETERALKLVRDMESESITPSIHVLENLLHACGSRREFREESFAIIKRIYDFGRPLHLNLCNFMLKCYATNCDLEEFYNIWNVLVGKNSTIEKSHRPNIYSFSAMFRLLANIPTSKREAKSKKIAFHYNLLPMDIIVQAKKSWNLLASYSHIKMESFILNDYLLVLATHGQKTEVERFFNNQFATLDIPWDKDSYQHMFFFYMRTNDFLSASTLKFKMNDFGLITRTSWHHLIHMASRAKQFDIAVSYIDQMVQMAIEPPSFAGIRPLYLSVVNAERWDLRSKLNALCKQPQDVDSFKGGKREIWATRNSAINTLLDFAYGRPGGECNVRGIYDNIKSNVTLLPSDQDCSDTGVNSEAIPGFAKLMGKKAHFSAPLPTKKRLSMNHQARKKRALSSRIS